jgi:hypothetical protein
VHEEILCLKEFSEEHGRARIARAGFGVLVLSAPERGPGAPGRASRARAGIVPGREDPLVWCVF